MVPLPVALVDHPVDHPVDRPVDRLVDHRVDHRVVATAVLDRRAAATAPLVVATDPPIARCVLLGMPATVRRAVRLVVPRAVRTVPTAVPMVVPTHRPVSIHPACLSNPIE